VLHVAAALGAIDAVKALIEDAQVPVDVQNDNSETPLYKACQAGHAQVIHYLLDKGVKASTATKSGNLTALHWLFTLPETYIRDIATRLVREGGASVNAVMVAPIGEGSSNFPQKIPISHLYVQRRPDGVKHSILRATSDDDIKNSPFELPLGTPLHWAVFTCNTFAVDVLVKLGADIDATYHNADASTTPLALAAWFGESEVVSHLLSKGADGKVRDAQDRNILHFISNHLPDRHGALTHYWYYWIRHGNWEKHAKKMTELINALIEGGADLEGVANNDRGKTTHIILAATARVWDGGAICAMLGAFADVNEAKKLVGDTGMCSNICVLYSTC
jgi:hypothetical protein